MTNERYDCSWCHSFSRPERGLQRPAGSDTTLPTVTAFSVPATAASLTVPISTFTATDNVAVTGYLVTETSTKPTAGAVGWSVVQPTIYTFASAGSKTLYGWARDAAGNVSNSRSATVTITLSAADTQAPTVTAFSVPATASALTVPISTLTATDNVAVTGYLVTETSARPTAGAGGWTGTTPTTYTVASDGSYTLYPWAKDAIGNVSAVFASPRAVVVDTTMPTVTSIIRGSASPTNLASLDFTVTFSESVTGVATGDFALTITGPISGESVTGVSGGPTIYSVTVNRGSGTGTLRLDMPSSATITDQAGNPLAGLPYTGGETYTVEKLSWIYLPLIMR